MEPKGDLADFLQRFSTKALWHFTGYDKLEDEAFKRLLSIVQTQKLKISEKEPIITMPSQTKRWGYNCSCMCDIPFKDLKIHIIRYGHFAIAFHKRNAIINGYFNPMFYLHKNHFLLQHAETLIEELEKLSTPQEQLSKALEEFLYLLGTYVKLGDLLSDIHLDTKKDEEQNNNFYYEREWRSAYEWNFQEDDVAAIMLPQRHIIDFKNKLGNKFSNTSIISAEMIEVL